MALKRSVGIGALTLCVVLSGCKDDKCKAPDRDAAGCSGGHGGYAGSGRSGGSEGAARGGFGATGSASGGSGE